MLRYVWVVPMIISIHISRSRAGSDTSAFSPGAASSCFNPRSRTGSDKNIADVRPSDLASIHAPTRGATLGATLHAQNFQASIHAPARGATHHPVHPGQEAACFNPRSRTGSDTRHRPSAPSGMLQSTLPCGERQTFVNQVDNITELQSTLPHGERPQQI